MVVNVEIPEELAVRLHPIKDRLPEIIELGVRELNALNQSGYSGAAEVLEFLAKLPEPEEIVKCRDRKSTRLNSSHSQISYAVFCLKKKKRRREADNVHRE